jgi:hypothetical protein
MVLENTTHYLSVGWCPNLRVGLAEANDPRNDTNEHEDSVSVIS